jgi:hypothetical protein
VEPVLLPPDLKIAESVDKEHGRIEIRRIAVSAEVIPHLAWPGAAQVARIERIREIGGKASTETAYTVTSLTAAEAGPERLLEGPQVIMLTFYVIETEGSAERDRLLADAAGHSARDKRRYPPP